VLRSGELGGGEPGPNTHFDRDPYNFGSAVTSRLRASYRRRQPRRNDHHHSAYSVRRSSTATQQVQLCEAEPTAPLLLE